MALLSIPHHYTTREAASSTYLTLIKEPLENILLILLKILPQPFESFFEGLCEAKGLYEVSFWHGRL